MREITATPRLVIPLGRQGENQATIVKFPVNGWDELFGNGSYMLLHQRSGDVAPYPIDVTLENEVVYWTVSSADVYYMGYGTAELMYVVDEAVAKSVIYKTSVLKAIDGGEIPEPTPSWIEQVLEIGEKAEENQHNSEAWAVGQRGGVDVPDTDETYHNNSKWYNDNSVEYSLKSEAWAVGTRNGEPVESTDETYHHNSHWYAQNAAQSATEADSSAEDAAQSAMEAAAYVGSPLVATTAAGMTNTAKVYVYVGSETGYTSGNWYYHNGTAWVSGGVYNSIADDVASNNDIDTALYS